MKRILYSLIILCVSINIVKAQKPQPVYSIVKEEKPHSFFVEQAELWWKEIEKNDKNEMAWLYYYKANRYAWMTFKRSDEPEVQKLDNWLDESKYLKEAEEITELISKNIPETFTYYIVIKEGYPNNQERFEALQKAYELEPDNPDVYDELVVYYETNSNLEKRKEFNTKWYRSNDQSSGILNFNYNVLMSMKKGGAILTFGDNDTFPIWMLQDALGIREDITVLNVNLLSIKEYCNQVFKKLNIPVFDKEYPNGTTDISQKEIIDYIIKNKPADLPLFVSTPAWKQLKGYEDNLYIVGLVFEYSEKNIDNIALLRKSFEQEFALDYIYNQFTYDMSQGIVNKTNTNYIPGLIKLYQHYELSGEKEKAYKLKELVLSLAEKGGETWVKRVAEIFE